MAIETPPSITPAPLPAPQRGDRITFSNRVDAFVTWLTLAVTQFAAVALNVAANATEAMGFATAAQAARDLAEDYRDAAAASALASSNSAASIALTANSTSSVVLGTGTKVFTVPAGKPFQAGAPVRASSAADLTRKMDGTIVSYSGTTLTTTMASFTGSGTAADWAITVTGATGAQGATGGVNGGSLTDSLNEKRGVDTPAATTLDIWGSGGNNFTLTGTTTITGFAAAPQAGARRRLLAAADTPLTDGANFIIKGGSITLAPGDEVEVVAETTTKFRLTVFRYNGEASKANALFTNVIQLTATGSFTAKKTGWHQVILTGSGGQGGMVMASTQGAATGAGAGGYASKIVWLFAGQTVSYTRGTGAAAATLSAVGLRDGTDGGVSMATGPGLALVANGGTGGKASNTAGAALAGGVGGTASGGDVNVKGGDGGSIALNAWKAGTWLATGGGAVGIQGIGYSAGTAYTFDSGVGSSAYAASGGAGVGGASGDALGTSASPAASGGGGAGGASPAGGPSSAGGPNYAGVAAGAVAVWGLAVMNATGGGQGGNDTNIWTSIYGGGSAGVRSAMNISGSAGAFAGSGGFAYSGTPSRNLNGGAYGGGGGGLSMQASSGSATVGAADGGTLIVYF